MFWILSASLLLFASLFVLMPLWRQQRAAHISGLQERDAANLAIYQERMAELDADLHGATIDPQQYTTLKLELERNLLADIRDDSYASNDKAQKSSSWSSSGKLIPLVLVLSMVPLSYAFYQQWGFHDELVLRDLHEQTLAAADDPEQALEVIYLLTDFIDNNRDSGWAWYFLSQNLSTLGQYAETSIALERASSLIEQPADKAFLLGRYALNEYMLSDRQLNDKVRYIINQAQRLDPNQLFVLQILALDAEQSEDLQSAITYWQRVLQMAPSGDDSGFFRSHIAELESRMDAQSDPASEIAGSGPVIDVEVELAPGLNLDPDSRVFVSALEVNGRGQPLAAKVLNVRDLPATVTLDNSAAIGPFNLSSAEMVYVVATVSVSGTANVQAGDYQVRSEGFQHSNTHAIIQLQIKETIVE